MLSIFDNLGCSTRRPAGDKLNHFEIVIEEDMNASTDMDKVQEILADVIIAIVESEDMGILLPENS